MKKSIAQMVFPNLTKDSKGFSLIELIIVIVIIGVLSGISIPLVAKYVEDSREAADKANVDTVYNAFNIAVTNSEVTINPGVITLKSDGTLSGIGDTLTNEFAKIFGKDGRTSPTAKGFKVKPLTSRKYQNNNPRFDFQWFDPVKKTGYIKVTYLNPVD